jgi:phosphate transport system permease protein
MTDLPGQSPEMAGLPGSSPEMTDLPGPAVQPTGEGPATLDPLGSELPDPSGPLTPSGHLRRRQLISRLTEAGQTTSALLAVAVLGTVVYSVASRGVSVLNIHFLTKDPLPSSLVGKAGGGIAPAIAGTAVIMAIATAIAMPVGILVALYLTEFAGPRSKPPIRLALDLLNGLPTIVVGLFVFGLLVVGHHQSGFAGAFALAIIMLPLIARATQEVLLLVPSSMREAADALGVSHWRTVLGVVLPTARGGILTATVLAVARAAGETAPLIFTSSIFANTVSVNPFGSQGLSNIPVYIFTASEAADPYGFARAWGAAFVLLMFILLASLGGRALGRRSSTLSP